MTENNQDLPQDLLDSLNGLLEYTRPGMEHEAEMDASMPDDLQRIWEQPEPEETGQESAISTNQAN